MNVVLIRHAQTQWNTKGLIQGRLDSPVTTLGERQVTALIDALLAARIAPQCVFSSPAGRAQHMAAPLARQFAAPVLLQDELHEQSFGLYEGRPHAQYPFADDAQAIPAQGESLAQAAQRLRRFIQQLPHDYAYAHDTVALVSHGSVIQAAMAWYCEKTLANVARYHHPNASYSLLDITPQGCQVVRWGVATHLLSVR